MSTYLVVAHQTATSPKLLDALKQKADREQGADFVLLVPQTAPEAMLQRREGTPRDVARQSARSAENLLTNAGVRIRWTVISDQAPAVALDTELADHPSYYAGVILSTLPEGISAWLDSYIVGVAEKHLLGMLHVVSTPEDVLSAPFANTVVGLNSSDAEAAFNSGEPVVE